VTDHYRPIDLGNDPDGDMADQESWPAKALPPPLPVTQDPRARLFVVTLGVKLITRAATVEDAIERAITEVRVAYGLDVCPDTARVVDRI
jgi:hypothetical protein